ncbi:hypothetical protein NHX12_033565, partial [Muraenolepis orangiensis]
FVPGELSRLESTLEDGGYESETQERGSPPPPPYPYVGDAGPQALMPMGGSFGYFYPYDWRLLTGQYPPGTYTHVSSSLERGRDDWQENHYLGYDYPASPQEEQQFQTFPSTSDQSFQLPALLLGGPVYSWRLMVAGRHTAYARYADPRNRCVANVRLMWMIQELPSLLIPLLLLLGTESRTGVGRSLLLGTFCLHYFHSTKIDTQTAALRQEIVSIRQELHTTISSLQSASAQNNTRIDYLEHAATEWSLSVMVLEATVKGLKSEVSRLSDKCLDLEGQSVRLVVIEEGNEGNNPRQFCVTVLKEILELEDVPRLDHGHRTLAPKPREGEAQAVRNSSASWRRQGSHPSLF